MAAGTTRFGLADLIAPVTIESFFSQYWEMKPLYLARQSELHYSRLVSLTNIENILSTADIRHPAIRLAKDGRYLPPDTYSRNLHYGDDSFSGVPDLDIVYAHYRTGATIILPALHRLWEPLNSLCRTMEEDLNHVVHTNVYLTPGNTSGFSAHYDAHEVFILQIDGKKHWRVYEPPFLLPHHSQPFSPEGYVLPKPLFEVDLLPGDLLYLPRGYIHDTLTSESHSVHVTLGITVYTWVELVAEALSTCKEHVELRKALPPSFANSEKSIGELATNLGAVLENLATYVEPRNVAEVFAAKIKSGTVQKQGEFKGNVSAITLDSPLRRLPNQRFQVAYGSDTIALSFDGKTMKVPSYVRQTLDAMLSSEAFRPRELTDELGPQAVLTLVSSLYLAGFLYDA